MTHDVFISHTAEDHSIAADLAQALLDQGLSVMVAESELHLGDSLREAIGQGFSQSYCGILILSPAFLSMLWSRRELDSLGYIQAQHPFFALWHGVTADEIRRYSEELVTINSLSNTADLTDYAKTIADVVRAPANPSNSNQYTQQLYTPPLYGNENIAQNKLGTLRGSQDSGQMTRMLAYYFSDSEIRTLSFQLEVDYDSLEGFTKEERAKDLVWRMVRRGDMERLVETVKQIRPSANW